MYLLKMIIVNCVWEWPTVIIKNGGLPLGGDMEVLLNLRVNHLVNHLDKGAPFRNVGQSSGRQVYPKTMYFFFLEQVHVNSMVSVCFLYSLFPIQLLGFAAYQPRGAFPFICFVFSFKLY